MGESAGKITASLKSWSRGDPAGFTELIAAVEPELKRAAQFYFRQEDAAHTLQPTALVSELCLRLMGWKKVQWENRQQFFSFAGKLMRYLLVDYAKARKTAKRGGQVTLVSLTGAWNQARAEPVDLETLLSLDDALSRLEGLDRRAARVVELRFFTGLSSAETARVLGVDRSTVTRDWTMAKEYLARELGPSTVAPLHEESNSSESAGLEPRS